MNEEILFSLQIANEAMAIFKVAGYINFDTSEELFDFITKAIEEKQPALLVFDVEGVEYVSSAGLGIFMSLVETVESRGGKIALVAPSEGFRRVMELTGALGYFTIYESMQEAQNLILSEHSVKKEM
jgi:anti-sigma B factor antagonist